MRHHGHGWTQAKSSDHTDQQLLDLAAALIAHCARVLRDDHSATATGAPPPRTLLTLDHLAGDANSKGPTFAFGGCDVQVRQLLKCPVDMAALVDCLLEREAERAK